MEQAVDQLLERWHGDDESDDIVRRGEIQDIDPQLFDLIYELAAVRGGLR